jgi:O-antigen/teichoic acid export membrane protein
MGATQYGIWTQITVTLTLLAPILMLRLEIASVRYLSSKTGQDASRDFFPMLLLVFAIVIGVGGIAYFFNDSLALFLFNDASQTYFVNLFLLILIARTLFQFSINFYRVSKQMKKYSLIELLTAFFEIGGAVYLVLNGVGLEGVLLPFIVVEFFAVILILADIIRQIGLPDKIQISRTFRYIRYSAPLIVNRFENWIVESGDRYLITHILSVAQAGIYSASYVIGQLAVFFLWPITFVLFPTITKLWEEKKYDEVTRYMQDSLRYFLLLSVPCVVGIYYLSPELLTLLTTDEFTKDRTLVLFITLGIFCLGVSQIYIYVLHLKEKTRNMALLFIGAAIANITLNLILIPEMGIRGAAIATFIAYLVRLAFVMGYSAKLHWIGFDLVFFFKALAASLGMYIVLTFISPESLLALLGAIGAGAISYILIMVLLKAIGIAELKAIRGLIQPKKASQS